MRDVAVILVNYKNSEDTERCLKSILALAEPPLWIVIVDNSPNDLSLNKLSSISENIKIIFAERNEGFGVGNNLGLAWVLDNTDANFILFLNNDTVVNDSLAELRSSFLQYADAAFVVPKIVFSGESSVLWYGGGEIDWKKGSAIVPGFGGSSDTKLANSERRVTFATGCALLTSRKIVEKIGLFDPVYFMYEEDVDLSLKATAYGFSIYYIPSVLVEHRVQGSQRKPDEKYVAKWSVDNTNYKFHIFYMVRNSLINVRKHAKGKQKLVFMLYYPFFLIARLGPFIVKGKFEVLKPVIKGIYSGLCTKLNNV